ncbi:MAG: hypothetical protein NTV64_06955 [Polaromonas sp.]|nr:hypothetical protein [Polaromonas sp.]
MTGFYGLQSCEHSQTALERAKKKPLERGFFERKKKDYFFFSSFLAQALSLAFSFLEQSTFLSSILPPAWLPAKDGALISMNAETMAVRMNFMMLP